MLGISGFFQNIKNAFTKEIALRLVIQKAIKEYSGIEIPIEKIIHKNGVVALKSLDSIEKSVLFTKKVKILDQLNRENIKITDIFF